ncbi:late competence development ComFB family protein [Alicyclobacillus fastidiosus]|uniref:Late competence development ComFB family protein n=1 Tax=Alicyclobacillus fastidiosus TaxID=392011 RepID=A0ABY6ZJU1_9BACL|nr:late competence development ComFB family protein [Alicyclobacillus fastidiosus]WAH42170.1 late competence development ComFB family protein [Alicyclobacillus fastidiosus]GMA63962.1 hypothetical protein GCM10025859_44020 [Alicyclobacillus fastidiosus]
MAVYNVTEYLATDMLASAEVRRFLTCSCQQCANDVLAMALNHLPTRYVSTEQGSVYVKADYLHPQWQSDVLAELIRAAQRVALQPHHDKLGTEGA